MIKKVGNDICPKTDIIKKYRSEFLQELKIKADKLYKKEIKNQKR
jgi:DNA-binding protein